MGKDGSKRLEILYLDDQVVVVNKPAGLPVIPLRTGKGPSLRELLVEELGGAPCWVVHRIDRETSGVVLFARDSESHRRLSRMFEHREIRKTYVAVVRGRPVPPEGTIELALVRDRDNPTRMTVARRAGKPAQPMAGEPARRMAGKPSRTEYRTLEVFRGYSLVELRPVTGRMHQVRVHLAAIGHPRAVDPLYGGVEAVYLSEFKRDYRAKRKQEERPLMGRLSLHARDITFEHPATGEVVFVEAALPRDFAVFLRQLSKHGTPPDER